MNDAIRLCVGILASGGGPTRTFVLDLVAETFARALERRAQFDPQRGPAVAWLPSIAHSLLVGGALIDGPLITTPQARPRPPVLYMDKPTHTYKARSGRNVEIQAQAKNVARRVDTQYLLTYTAE
jgi:hypothetical protein